MMARRMQVFSSSKTLFRSSSSSFASSSSSSLTAPSYLCTSSSNSMLVRTRLKSNYNNTTCDNKNDNNNSSSSSSSKYRIRCLNTQTETSHKRTNEESADDRERKINALRSAARIGLREAYGTRIGDIECLNNSNNDNERTIQVRCRQHVNPLSKHFQEPILTPDWSSLYSNTRLPLVVDIGSGPGRFLLKLATEIEIESKSSTHDKFNSDNSSNRDEMGSAIFDLLQHQHGNSNTNVNDRIDGHCRCFNYLGLEIREPLVHRALHWTKLLQLDHCVTFMNVNGTLHMKALLESYPGLTRPILVCIQFPDPHFKKRYHKRRIVQESLVLDLAELLPSGSLVFLQSDVFEVAKDMRNAFERFGTRSFDVHPCHQKINESSVIYKGDQNCESDDDDFKSEWNKLPNAGWLPTNPFLVPTEREILTSKSNLPVYRSLLRKL